MRNTRTEETLKQQRPISFGAGNESRTRDLNLGKVALYQLSYSRRMSVFAAVSEEDAIIMDLKLVVKGFVLFFI